MTRSLPPREGRPFAAQAKRVAVARCGMGERCHRELAAVYDERAVLPNLKRPAEGGPYVYLVVVQRDGQYGQRLDPADPAVYDSTLDLRCPKHGALHCRVHDIVEAPDGVLIVTKPPL